MSFVANKTFQQVEDECKDRGILIKTTPESDLYMLITDNPVYPDVNGIILQKETNRIICACQNKFEDISSAQDLNNLVNSSTPTRFEYCEDGTLIRLYHHNGVWQTATNRCINASDSFWASKSSFADLFWQVFDNKYLSSLNTNCTYLFILLHTENRIVVKHTKNMLVYVSRISNQSMAESFVNVFKDFQDSCIKRPAYIHMDSMKDLTPDGINKLFHPFKRGFIIKVGSIVYKYDFEQYKLVKELRGNVPDIRYRYIQLLRQTEQSVKSFEYYYGEHYMEFFQLRRALRDVVKEIYNLYVDSHITHKVLVDENSTHWRTLKQLHAQYKQSGQPISYLDVHNKVINMDYFLLHSLLKWDR
jgi:hypothetical protein